jgi:hypothetical protein
MSEIAGSAFELGASSLLLADAREGGDVPPERMSRSTRSGRTVAHLFATTRVRARARPDSRKGELWNL